MEITEVEEFLENPPTGFRVDVRRTGYRFVTCEEENCVFIDEFESAKGKVIFQSSPGRTIKVNNLKDYMQVRKNLTSKKIFIMVSLCETTSGDFRRKPNKNEKVLDRFIVLINGNNSLVKWEMEKGLDWTISSVAGESYRVDIDPCDALQSWADEHYCIPVDGQKGKVVWRDTHFTLKYHSDALFDFPYWLGCSKRKFKVSAPLARCV